MSSYTPSYYLNEVMEIVIRYSFILKKCYNIFEF